MAMHEVQHGNLRDFLTVLIKHQNKVIGVFAAAVLTVTAGSFIMTPIYESEATVMVKIGREYMYRPEVGSTGQAISYDQNRIVESEIQIFSSQDVAKGVITKIG